MVPSPEMASLIEPDQLPAGDIGTIPEAASAKQARPAAAACDAQHHRDDQSESPIHPSSREGSEPGLGPTLVLNTFP